MSEMLFHGRCPICGKQLLLDEDCPETAFCPKPKKHYSCDAEKFNQLWNDFDAQVKQLGMDVAVVVYSRKLLKDLRALNTQGE
jgi:hypothetical protein